MRRHIVVGVDGSGAGETALLWAAEEASRRGLHLLIALAGEVLTESEHRLSGARDESAEILRHSAATAMVAGRPCTIATMLREQPPTELLLALSEDAEMIVVGTHGRGRIAGALLGSVAYRVARNARCAVSVVPAGWRAPVAGSRRFVAVGVSPSRPGYEALEFAFAAAEQRGVLLLAVRSRPGFATRLLAATADGYDGARDGQQPLLTTLVRTAGRTHPGVEVVTELSRGPAAAALLAAAERAELLVVGRPDAADRRLCRLGAVMPHLLPSVACPVVVIGQPVQLSSPRAVTSRIASSATARPDAWPALGMPLDPAGRTSVQAGSSYDRP